MEALLKVTDAARALRVSSETVRRWVREGRIRAIQTPSGHLRIPQDEIDRVRKGEPSPTEAETPARFANRTIQQKREAVELARLEIELNKTRKEQEDLEEQQSTRRQERLAAEQRARAEESMRAAELRRTQEAEREASRREYLQAAEEERRRQAAAEAARRRQEFLDQQVSLAMSALPYWATPGDQLKVREALMQELEDVPTSSSRPVLETIRQGAIERGLRMSRWKRMAESEVQTTWGISDRQAALHAILVALKGLDQDNTDDTDAQHVIDRVIRQFKQVEAKKQAVEQGMAYVSSYLHRLQQNRFLPVSLPADSLRDRYKSRVRTALEAELQGSEDAGEVRERVEQVIDEILGL
ncbi:MAG: helix-turn-helix domain-containing protein [Acidobacteria bacterium]|nr:helix-turn-helix domain-containing protein [Acidobacteriota bacterium]